MTTPTRKVKEKYFPYEKEYIVQSKPNPYTDRLANFPGTSFIDREPEILLGKWREFLHKPQNTYIHLDVGCGEGKYLINWAKLNPEKIYIGIDWKPKNIFTCAERTFNEKLQNIKWLKTRAERLAFIFDEAEVDKVTVYHPDPWPKRAQAHNRLLQSQFFKSIHKILKPCCELEIKTDHEDYYNHICNTLAEESGFQIVKKETVFEAINSNPTRFEKIFLQKGQPIFWIFLQKKS